MIKTKAELVSLSKLKDEVGRPINGEITVLKTVYLGSLIPKTHRNFPKEYGSDIQGDYGALTFADVSINDHLRINDKLYRVIESMDYPNRAKMLLLELM